MSEPMLNYTDFTNLAIKLGSEDAQSKFEELCEYAIINNPNYIRVMIRDDEVAPYLSLKYINILITYLKYLESKFM